MVSAVSAMSAVPGRPTVLDLEANRTDVLVPQLPPQLRQPPIVRTMSSNARDPREVEMLAIINMQPVPEEVRKGVEQLELAQPEEETSLDAEKPAEPEVEDEILKPGTKIRPEVDVQVARKLAERLYGIVAAGEVKELISYDDRNFLIQADSNIKNPIIANQWPHGYILKVHNSLDSRKAAFIDAQTQLMLFLGQQNIRCPRPVMNITGKYYSLERLADADGATTSTTSNCVRLLEFVPGQLFHQVPNKTPHLFYQAGQFVGRLDNALKHFKHDAYSRHRSLWQLDAVPRLAEFVYALKDETRQEIVDQVLEQFDRRVVQRIGDFQRGIIHGDFNEQNIVVEESVVGGGDWRISGVIDFGDTSESCYVFELAIAMAYMILQGGDIATGGLVLAGYGMVRPVPEHEREVLKVCVAARLCQSLVLGAYSHSLEPDNEYVLSTQAAGWGLLEKLWSEPELLLQELWKSTGDRYLTQSSK